MARPLIIWLLNPYHDGSHRAWADGYASHSRHRVLILSMKGQFWKWRMQGGALELAGQASALCDAGLVPDVLLATSMVNVPAFLALVRRTAVPPAVPIVLYMHENQLTYPQPPGSKRDLTYGMIQHLSMLAADQVCFNSQYHLESWFAEVPRLLRHFPDYTHQESIREARARSLVLPVGCELRRYDAFRCMRPENSAPLVLWNQRWEYDKDPAGMLDVLCQLAATDLPFEVAIAGENFRVQPIEFVRARQLLANRLVHFGYAEGLAEYASLLWRADIVLSTAIHEFFGISIVEAMYCRTLPLLPKRLSYPELLLESLHARCLYGDRSDLVNRLQAEILKRQPPPPGCRTAAERFEWQSVVDAYDTLMEHVWMAKGRGR